MASPVGEDNWVEYVDHQLREAKDLESRVNVVESFRRAVSAEPGSLKVWTAYCEYFWSLYADCQPGSDAGWPAEEQQLGRETFTLDVALHLWQEGYEAVQYRLSDSHELWNRWISLEMELLSRTATQAGIQRITQLFKNRLLTPHATWDNTAQMYSSFLSEYNRQYYETEMQDITWKAKDAKRLYELRDPFELKLLQAAKSTEPDAVKKAMSDYLEWEIRQTKGKKDTVMNFQICLGLFSRALTGVMASDHDTWLDFLVLISTCHSDLKSNRAKIPASLLPNMLDVLQRAVLHVPWCGDVWARYILAAEEACLKFTDIERIKHAATNSAQLDRDGMDAVLEMYAAWCGYLKRKAMHPTATEEAVDIAEVGLPSAIEDVKHWGKRRYGDSWSGDPTFKLERILIQFLTEKKEDIEGARAVWEQLSTHPVYAENYDFWLDWHMWEMVCFTAAKNKARSPTPLTLARGLRVPTFATRVLHKALKVRTMNWPEKILDVYLQHCNDYEVAETLREAQDTVYKTRKGVRKRRDRERLQQEAAYGAQQQATYAAQAQQDHPMADAPQDDASPGSKRKRESAAEEGEDSGNKRVKNELVNGTPAELKRDRENTSVFVKNLPTDATQTKLRQFFREYGHINNIDLQKQEGAPAVALIEFRSPEDVQSAILRDGKYFGEQVVQVTPSTDCTLFVTNYPPEADEQYIRGLFRDCGEIHSVRFPSLKFNTKRRFCYVSFRDREAATKATQLDGKSLEGGKYKLQAKFSDPGHRQNRQGAQAEERELHVLNLPKSATEEEVKGLFAKAGKVVSVRIPRNMAGISHGTAFVVMETKEEAQEAIKTLGSLIFGNHPIKVELSKPLGQKTSATNRGRDGTEGSPAADSPKEGSSGQASTTSAGITARTIAVLGIPDTMTDARVKAALSPLGQIVKLVLHPKHGGAAVEFADAATAGKAALAVEGMEIEGGKKLRTGTVAELFKQKAERRVDRIDLPQQNGPKGGETKKEKKQTASELMPPPPAIRRPPVLGAGGRGGMKRGLGFIPGAISKSTASSEKENNNNAEHTNGNQGKDLHNAAVKNGPAAGKESGVPGATTGEAPKRSNDEFRRLFLQGTK